MGDKLAATGDASPVPGLRGARRRCCTRMLTLAFALVLSPLAGLGTALAAPPGAVEELTPPKPKSTVSIEYPQALLERDEPPAGTVIVQYVVDVDGKTKELEVLQSVDPELDRVVLDAVARLEFEPASYQGEPVEVVLSVAIELGPPTPIEPPEPELDPDEIDPDAIDPDATDPAAALPVTIRGRVREAGKRLPLEGATVLAVPAPEGWPLGKVKGRRYEAPVDPAWQIGTPTDAAGNFELRGVPAGRVRIVVLSPGFERLDYVEELAPNTILELDYFDRRLESNPYRTEVTVSRELPEVTRRSITPEEINALPGTQGDALKSIQNFPGVARPPFGAGLRVVRGSAPSDTKAYLGYHEIPQLFHFGAITSVFNSDMLAQIDFIPGNFDSRFGNAIGGIINVQPRKGRRDGYHGYVDADLFDAGGLVEGPVGKGSFAVSVRRSYVDAILLAVIPKDAGIDFNVAPRYWDYQALFDHPLGDGNLSVRVFGSDDKLAIVNPDINDTEPDGNDGFQTQIAFHRVDLVYEAEHGPWSVLITPSYRHDLLSGIGGNIFSFRVLQDTLSFRGELGYRISKRAALRIGTELRAGTYSMDARAPGFPGVGTGDSGQYLAAELGGPLASIALYATSTIAVTDRFVLYPGMRFSYSGIVLKRSSADPRLRFAWKVGDATTIKGGVGLYSQVPDIFEFNDVWGNPKIALEKAVHNSVGVEHVFEDLDLLVEATLFYKHVYSVAIPTSTLLFNTGSGTVIVPERFDNAGFGRIGGLELLVRKNLSKNLFGWLSYTFSRSFYDFNDGEGLTRFDFDQPHILTLVGVYKLPRGWSVGGRFRLVSGNPYTPAFNGFYDASVNSWVPREGPRNSARQPAFHQFDLRVDKVWTWRYVALNFYVDFLNLYNRRNPEGLLYSYNYTMNRILAGLPILPSIGLKLEW
jgi:TonB family protein